MKVIGPWLAFALLAAAGGACVKIDGGAVEVSWVIRSTTGSAITHCDCADPPISAVRLVLIGVGGAIDGATPCAGKAQCQFPCQRQTGSTAFDIAATNEGEKYEISVVAVGADGQEISPSHVMTPAPILRDVVVGQPTEVEAIQMVAPCAAACSASSSGICARP